MSVNVNVRANIRRAFNPLICSDQTVKDTGRDTFGEGDFGMIDSFSPDAEYFSYSYIIFDANKVWILHFPIFSIDTWNVSILGLQYQVSASLWAPPSDLNAYSCT